MGTDQLVFYKGTEAVDGMKLWQELRRVVERGGIGSKELKILVILQSQDRFTFLIGNGDVRVGFG